MLNRLHLKPHNIARVFTKFHANQVNRLTTGFVFIRVVFVFNLLQSSSFGHQLNYLKFKDVNAPLKLDRHVHAAMVGGVFERYI